MHKIYSFNKVQVFFKHTDFHGFVHPYNFYEWMSFAREAYFQEMVKNFRDLCDGSIKMVTTKVDFELIGDAVFGDRIIVKIYSQNIKRLSFDVVFEFVSENEEKLIARGRQKLTFIDTVRLRPARIPPELKDVVALYELKKEDIQANK